MRPFTKKLLFLFAKVWRHNRIIRKEMKTQHQNPEFGHKHDEIPYKTCNKYISIQGRVEMQKNINS
jgi:hypothetical protein